SVVPGKVVRATCSSTFRPALPTPKIFTLSCFAVVWAAGSFFCWFIACGVTTVAADVRRRTVRAMPNPPPHVGGYWNATVSFGSRPAKDLADGGFDAAGEGGFAGAFAMLERAE